MRILLTGASSFTGYWFAHELSAAGHSVAATFTHASLSDYQGVRHARVQRLLEDCAPVFDCRFGDDRFLRAIHDVQPDVLCHHAAFVTDYKSPSFDYVQALAVNTHRVADVFERLAAIDCNRVVFTGTVFEEQEGAGSEPLVSFSPYGLSKALSDRVLRHYGLERHLSLGKFVIPNPFGPWEDPRFTAYLVRCWQAGEVAQVRTPAYIRDNIHVSLLAKAYTQFIERMPTTPGFTKANPSGYIESQGAFAERFAHEMRERLPWQCEVDLVDQVEFPEPRVRINTMPLDYEQLAWQEAPAWDAIAEYYESTIGAGA